MTLKMQEIIKTVLWFVVAYTAIRASSPVMGLFYSFNGSMDVAMLYSKYRQPKKHV